MKAKTKKNTIVELTKHVALLYARTEDLNNRLKIVEEQDYKSVMADTATPVKPEPKQDMIVNDIGY